MEEVGATIRCILESVASADEQAKACVIDVRSLMLSANLNIIGRMLFSKRLFDLDTKPDTDVHDTTDGLGVPAVSPRRKAAEEFKSFVKEATKLIGGSFNAGDYIPALRWLDLQGYQ
jgi:flavonoid 3'-monooxygenase